MLCRGNHGQAVFRDARDCRGFLSVLGEVCARTGWVVHCYALMGNHYHLLLETPEPNLVSGMQWLQGTYTKRFNVRHREWGHLFQGRYKALLVDGADHYFATVSSYIHLNPVRVKGYDFGARLEEYEWSSYGAYLGFSPRPPWLGVERVLGSFDLEDSEKGRLAYREYIEHRILEMENSSKPWEVDALWKEIRRGWCLGGNLFREDMLVRMDGVLEAGQRASFSGVGVARHDEVEAERLVGLGMAALGMQDSDLESMAKGASAKYAIAWIIRKNTSVRTGWIKKRLSMGAATNFADYLKRVECATPGKWGYDEFKAIENINL